MIVPGRGPEDADE
jgi:hypothetical protein